MTICWLDSLVNSCTTAFHVCKASTSVLQSTLQEETPRTSSFNYDMVTGSPLKGAKLVSELTKCRRHSHFAEAITYCCSLPEVNLFAA